MRLPPVIDRRPTGLAEGLARKVTAWKGRERPLLALERRRYLNAM